MSAGILSSHRLKLPFRMLGCSPGEPGINRSIPADGCEEPLAGCAGIQVNPGAAAIIETPGGGGYGPA